MTKKLNDIEFNAEITKFIGSLVYNKQLRVERKSAASTFDEIHVFLGSDQGVDMVPLREFYSLGFEIRSIRNDFEVKYKYEDATGVEGNTEIVFVRSPSNINASAESKEKE